MSMRTRLGTCSWSLLAHNRKVHNSLAISLQRILSNTVYFHARTYSTTYRPHARLFKSLFWHCIYSFFYNRRIAAPAQWRWHTAMGSWCVGSIFAAGPRRPKNPCTGQPRLDEIRSAAAQYRQPDSAGNSFLWRIHPNRFNHAPFRQGSLAPAL